MHNLAGSYKQTIRRNLDQLNEIWGSCWGVSKFPVSWVLTPQKLSWVSVVCLWPISVYSYNLSLILCIRDTSGCLPWKSQETFPWNIDGQRMKRIGVGWLSADCSKKRHKTASMCYIYASISRPFASQNRCNRYSDVDDRIIFFVSRQGQEICTFSTSSIPAVWPT